MDNLWFNSLTCKKLNFSLSGVCVGPLFNDFNYNSEEGAHATLIDWVPGPQTSDSDINIPPFHGYVNGGGHFVTQTKEANSASVATQTDNSNLHAAENVTILGRYEEIDDMPIATVRCKVGKGVAVLSQVHLEYDPRLLPQDDPHLIENGVLTKLFSDNSSRIKAFRTLLKLLRLHVLKRL